MGARSGRCDVPDLSVIIPARNEMFLAKTVENILTNARADTECIVVCDGCWPDPPLYDHPKIKVIHHSEAVGQRAATNDGVKLSRAKYVMKMDAHCCVDEGFDVKLIQDCQPNWTMVPKMYNLHSFDWKCLQCGEQTYQGSKPAECGKCHGRNFEMVMIWQPRWNRVTTAWVFDGNIQFQYSRKQAKRRHAQQDIHDTMCFIGAYFFMTRDRFWEIGGLDEEHGSWGQYGVEISCKSWLSGGRLVTTKRTWVAHLFRTGNFAMDGHSTFPYPLSQQQIERARTYSRDLWRNNLWPGQKYPLSWLVEKFWPIDGWTDEQLQEQKQREQGQVWQTLAVA